MTAYRIHGGDRSSPTRRRHRPARPFRRIAAAVAVVGLVGCAASVGAQGQQANPAAALFEKQCYSCHNIVGGKKKGPDLRDLTKRRERRWIQKFIPAPKDMKNSGDKTAVQLFREFAPEEMPDQMLSPDQIDQLLAFIEQVSASGKAFIPQSGRLARPVRPGDAAAGYAIYVGKKGLKNQGPACIQCHSVQGVGPVGGGTLGPDLTQANTRYTDIELASILKAPAFPTMTKLFANSQLTDEEVVQVFAYLQSARQRTPDSGRYGFAFVLMGCAGAAAAMGLMSHIWRQRLRGGVRRGFVASAVAKRREARGEVRGASPGRAVRGSAGKPPETKGV